jgi:hypothetical protein
MSEKRKALLERAARLREQAAEASDPSIRVREALETVATGYEILADNAPADDETAPEAEK